jgi:hypothetical protein
MRRRALSCRSCRRGCRRRDRQLDRAGEPDEFAGVAAQCPVPLAILGGPKRPEQRDTIADIAHHGGGV